MDHLTEIRISIINMQLGGRDGEMQKLLVPCRKCGYRPLYLYNDGYFKTKLHACCCIMCKKEGEVGVVLSGDTPEEMAKKWNMENANVL